MKVHDILREFICVTGNFPGNKYWGNKFEKAFNEDNEATNDRTAIVNDVMQWLWKNQHLMIASTELENLKDEYINSRA